LILDEELRIVGLSVSSMPTLFPVERERMDRFPVVEAGKRATAVVSLTE
jgi:hypothetical protein